MPRRRRSGLPGAGRLRDTCLSPNKARRVSTASAVCREEALTPAGSRRSGERDGVQVLARRSRRGDKERRDPDALLGVRRS